MQPGETRGVPQYRGYYTPMRQRKMVRQKPPWTIFPQNLRRQKGTKEKRHNQGPTTKVVIIQPKDEGTRKTEEILPEWKGTKTEPETE